VQVINELIRQIADLVAENHEKILEVVTHVDEGAKATDKGKESLRKAEEYAEQGFKNRCWCLLAILGLCMVVLLPVLMSVLSANGVI
jgi:t-SNARE complex subunit (syntaxin)